MLSNSTNPLIARTVLFAPHLRVKPHSLTRLALVCLLPLSVLALLASPTLAQARAQNDRSSGPALTASQPRARGYVLSPGRAAEAIAYARARHELYFVDLAYSVVLLLLFLRLRVAPKFRDRAERAARNTFLQACIFAAPLLLAINILSLPTAAASHWLARRYGQSIQDWPSWLADWAKAELLGVALGVVLVWLLYAAMRRSPRRWWLYAWLGSLPILIVIVLVSPVIVEPLFFHFSPLSTSDPALAAQLERVVMRAGQQIPESRMYVMNASSKLNQLNAYVTGLGSSERVVVWDTTIARMTTPEITFVFGHEMGHYVLGHIRKGLMFAAVLLLFGFYAGFHCLRWMLRRFGASWALRGPADSAALPALLLLMLLFDFALTPVSNAYSRCLEHQADRYGLEVVHGIVTDAPEVAAQSFQILGDVDLEEPNPSWFVKMWFYTHPTIDERIRFARSYDPWGRGQSPKFVK